MEANDGMAQQVAENRTELLELLSTEELNRRDDLGLSLAYLAVYYDRPKILQYLHDRGVDLSLPCDSADYGTPMYYAVTMQRHQCVITLDLLGPDGTSIHAPCTKFDELPRVHAERVDDAQMIATLDYLQDKEERAADMFLKHFYRSKARKHYLEMRKSALFLQRIARGYIARKKLRKLKARKAEKEREAAALGAGGKKKR